MNNSPKIKKLLEYYHNKQFDEAENLALMMTIELHDHPIPWQVLGAIFSQTGRKSEAVDAHLKALQISPENPQAHNNYGITLQELGRFDEAGPCHALTNLELSNRFDTRYASNPGA